MFGFPLSELLLLILGFGFLIFVHELGHFMVAKWVGIKCTQFAIGFGPSIVAWRKGIGFRVGSTEPEYDKRLHEHFKSNHNESDTTQHAHTLHREDFVSDQKKTSEMSQTDVDRITAELGLGDTEYRLNYLPLGGYVKMLGQEDLDPNAQSDNPRAYNNKPIWARMCVISAGVVMNLIFGLIFFIIAFRMGVMFPPAIVGGVAPGSPAAITYADGHDNDPNYQGLKIGDRVTLLDGEPISDMIDIRIATALGKAGEPIAFTVEREGLDQPLVYNITPVASEASDGLLAVGMMPPSTLQVASVSAGSPAAEAGVERDMILTTIAGKPVTNQAAFERALIDAKGEPVAATFTGDGKTVETTLSAFPMLTNTGQTANLLGLEPATRVVQFPEKGTSRLRDAGGLPGDTIAEVYGQAWPTPDQLVSILGSNDSRPTEVKVYRDGEVISLGEITPHKGKLGFHLDENLDTPIVASVLPGSPAAALELTPGSRILAINNQPVSTWADMQRILGDLPKSDEPVDVSVRYRLNIAGQPEENATIALLPETVKQLADARWIGSVDLAFTPLLEPVVGDNSVDAVKLGFTKTGQFMAQTYITLLRLFEGSVKPEHLRGPVGIVDEGTKMAQRGNAYLLFFLGLISVNLAVINFLPLPIVDGGHMVFLIIEKIKGSPASPAVQIGAMWVGLVLIACVFLLVTYNDIYRLVAPYFG